MSIDYNVPFYSNTPDDTHCWQAALKMVLKYFESDKEYTWEVLDKKTEKIEDLWTWPQAGLLWLSTQGYAVKDIEAFNYERFVKEKSQYLYSEFGQQVTTEIEKHSDVQQGIMLSQKLLTKGLWTKATPTIEEIKDFLNEGYLIVCNLNAARLNEKEGYVGHSVVVKGCTENELILHDPGLPPLENRKVTYAKFEKAWSYPDEKAKNIMAFKLVK